MSEEAATEELWVAAQAGDEARVQALIVAGADVNKARTTDGATPLYVASAGGHTAVVQALIAAGADVDKATTDNGMTPLYVASVGAHTAVMQALIAAGADVDKARTDNGWTPLMVASYFGHLPIVSRLIAAGAKLDVVGRDGDTALSWAQSDPPPWMLNQNYHQNREGVARLLRRHLAEAVRPLAPECLDVPGQGDFLRRLVAQYLYGADCFEGPLVAHDDDDDGDDGVAGAAAAAE